MSLEEAVSFQSNANIKRGIISFPKECRLTLVDGRLKAVEGDGDVMFDVPVDEVTVKNAPFYYWKTAFKLTAGGRKYTVAFTKLSDTTSGRVSAGDTGLLDRDSTGGKLLSAAAEVQDIPRARALCREWRTMLYRATGQRADG